MGETTVNIADLFGPGDPDEKSRHVRLKWLGLQLLEVAMTPAAHTMLLEQRMFTRYDNAPLARALSEEAVPREGWIVGKLAGTEIEKFRRIVIIMNRATSWVAEEEMEKLIKSLTDGPDPVELIAGLG